MKLVALHIGFGLLVFFPEQILEDGPNLLIWHFPDVDPKLRQPFYECLFHFINIDFLPIELAPLSGLFSESLAVAIIGLGLIDQLVVNFESVVVVQDFDFGGHVRENCKDLFDHLGPRYLGVLISKCQLQDFLQIFFTHLLQGGLHVREHQQDLLLHATQLPLFRGSPFPH